MNTVFIGIGSNLGNREKHIQDALNQLQMNESIELISLSNQYETTAVSNYDQPKYINCVAKISTLLSPEELLTFTQFVELDMGRINKGTGAPRTIDLDILFYDDLIFTTDDLIIPHPLAHERLFVLNPMADIAPDFVHPLLNISISNLRQDLNGY